MATTQLTRTREQVVQPESQADFCRENRSLCLSWVVVTDNSGKRQLRMRWTGEEDGRPTRRLLTLL